MTSEKLISVFRYYDQELEKRGIKSIQLTDYTALPLALGTEVALEHVRQMCQASIELVEGGRIEKAFRWLGFIQGVLWMANIYPIEDLKNHSRPDGAE